MSVNAELTSPGDLDAVLAELPADGTAILSILAMDRVVEGMSRGTWPGRRGRAWGALALLCTEGRARVFQDHGHSWAARVL